MFSTKYKINNLLHQLTTFDWCCWSSVLFSNKLSVTPLPLLFSVTISLPVSLSLRFLLLLKYFSLSKVRMYLSENILLGGFPPPPVSRLLRDSFCSSWKGESTEAKDVRDSVSSVVHTLVWLEDRGVKMGGAPCLGRSLPHTLQSVSYHPITL